MVVGGTLLVGALGGFLIANSDRFQRTLQEVTLPCDTRTSSASRPTRRRSRRT
jgi:hypothetical protein